MEISPKSDPIQRQQSKKKYSTTNVSLINKSLNRESKSSSSPSYLHIPSSKPTIEVNKKSPVKKGSGVDKDINEMICMMAVLKDTKKDNLAEYDKYLAQSDLNPLAAKSPAFKQVDKLMKAKT